LIEGSNQQNQINLESDQLEINTNNQTNTIEIQNIEDTDKKTSSKIIEDDIMMMDDCAIIPDSFPTNNTNHNKNNNINNKKSNDNKIRFKLQADQLKSGLTASNTLLSSIVNIQPIASKELSIIQLYLALNKPNTIKLKYDWIIINNCSNNSELTGNVNYFSSQNNQNQQQRFYIDTLASVAVSFLNELNQKTAAFQNTSTASSNNTNLIPKSTNNPIIPPVASSNKLIKSPPKAISSNSKPFSEQSIAIIQPNPNGQTSTTTIIPVETVLQRINEDQTNKTKILLSDLNTKRRSRTRKPIMVVNNSHHPPRNVLPKLTLSNGQFIKPINVELNNSTNINNNINIQSPYNINSPSSSSSNQSEQIQNIVVSGPVAAVARQIVNTNNLISSQPLTTTTLLQTNNNSSNKVLIQSFHQYSNLIPQILNNLNENTNMNVNNQVIIDGEPVRIIIDNLDLNKQNNENNMNAGSPHGLTNMSLLDLSINNNDSFFAAASAAAVPTINPNNNNDDLNNVNNINLKEKISNDKDNTDSVGSFFTNLDINNFVKTKSMSNNNVSEALQDNSSISSLSSMC
jgi:hypothetical protein